MTEQAHSPICANDDNRYATRDDFREILNQGLNGFYLLSFLLTGDHQKGERCFAAGIEDCAGENRVFMEWAAAWAKRVIVKNAIRELNPRPNHSTWSALPTVFSHDKQSSGPIGHFALEAVLRLPDFERFVFVLRVLEHYRDQECALLLGCSASEVQDARTRALENLAGRGQVGGSRYQDRKRFVSRTA